VNRKYPILLLLEGRPCVVVGGGRVATRKVESLLVAGARVRVISPELHPDLRALRDAARLEHVARTFASGDLEGSFLVIAATDDTLVNEQVWREAEERGLLINTVDDPPRCNFYVPAVVRRGALTLAVSTDGKSCSLAAKLRRELEELFGPEYEPLVDLLGELRQRMKARVGDPGERKRLAQLLIEADLGAVIADEGEVAARSRAIDLLTAEGVA